MQKNSVGVNKIVNRASFRKAFTLKDILLMIYILNHGSANTLTNAEINRC